MKKIILLFFLSFASFAQNKDSLISVIKTYKKLDTLQCQRISLFIEQENDEKIWMPYNTVLGKICQQKLKTNLSKKEKEVYYYYYGTYHNNIGYSFSNKSNFDQALRYYKIAIDYYKKSKNPGVVANSLSNIGMCYIKKGEPQYYIGYQKQALEIYRQNGDSVGMAKNYADLGYVYADNGSESKALEYFFKSIKISDLIKNKETRFRAVEYLVKTLKSQNENQKALEYSQQLVSYFNEIEDDDSLALIYFSMASTYNAIGNFKKMIEYTAKSIAIARKSEFNNTIAANYGLLAKHYLTQKQLDKAYQYSFLEVQFREKEIKEPAYTKSLIRFSEILNLKNQNAKAQIIAQQTYQKSKELENPEMILMSARNLKTIYKGLGNTTRAFEFAEIEIKMNDSLNSINSKNSAIKSIFKYESEKKEAQIKSLSQQKKIADLESQRQKTIALILAIAIISLLITSYVLFNRFKIKKQNELLKSQLIQAQKTIEAEKKATESELKALKSQMNPHFIFNALSSIQDQFMYGDKVIANEQMGNFTYLTRQILNVSGKKQILLSTEIDILSKYLELEKMRFKTDFEYKITTSENIDEDYHEIPPMLIQPFVENSIKHGLLHKIGIKKVTIHFELDTNEEYIICTITDNGIGRIKSAEIKAKNQSKHKSFSTESIAQRLELLNENHSIKQLINYSDELENDEIVGTKVVVNIPLG